MARERHVGDLLREAFRRAGMTRGVARAEAVVLWPMIVGADVARFATAVALRDGTLVVDVPDPETALHLGMQRHHLLAAYGDRLGAGAVREIRFRVGRPVVADPPPAPATAPPSIDPDELAALARGLPDLGDDLSSAAMRVGKALLELRARRSEAGWRPCPVCHALHEPSAATASPVAPELDPAAWCPTCARHAASPKVGRAGVRLLAEPTHPCPELTQEERDVAVRLARKRATAAAETLLPFVLADPARVGELRRLATVVAALHHGIAPDRVAPSHLASAVDPRVLRALPRPTSEESS
jgi:hypothetical protein